MKRLSVLICALLLGSMLATACIIPTNLNFTGYIAHLDAPNPGTILNAGQSVLVGGGVGFPASGPSVSRLEFYANAVSIGSPSSLNVNPGADAGSLSDTNGSINWIAPSTPGEYQLQEMATLSNGRIVASDPVRVCVLGIVFQGINNTGTGSVQPYGYTGACPLPPPLPISITDNLVNLSAHATPDSLAFQSRPSFCSGDVPTPTITFTANVRDLGGHVAFVIVNYSLTTSAGAFGDQGPVVLNQTSVSVPDRIYTGTTDDLTPLLNGDSVDSTGSSIPGTITWTAHAFDGSGALLASDGPYTINAYPCMVIPTVMPHVIQPFPTNTSTLVPPSTLTPTATLAPYIPPAKALSGCKSYTNQNDCAQNGCFWQFSTSTCHAKANSCSGYKDASSCTTNGCSWDKGSSTCH